MTIEFGLFEHVTRPQDDALDDLYERRIATVKHAEEVGVHGYYCAEHHGHRLTMAPSQLTWLAALARETEQIRLGTMVACLPLHHPLRVAEEVCMVDNLSHGRLEFGVGRGISPFEQNFFGHDAAEGKPRFTESLQLIMQALTTGRMDPRGCQYFDFPEAELSMETLQRPAPPMWYPGNIEFAARHGFSTVLPFPVTAEHREKYAAAYRSGLDDTDSRLHPDTASSPRIASSQWVFVADTDAEAQRIGRRAVGALNDLMRRSSSDQPPQLQPPLPPMPADSPFSVEGAFDKRGALAGSPETIRDYFLDVAADGADHYFITGLAFGDLTPEESDRSIELFLNEVVPPVKSKVE
jgi:alkanesulfonate monooxygenase SsuD/methylene tetrahydromethanopterin reductase-like flavin-dependent oxidoreductase (luciferase family)